MQQIGTWKVLELETTDSTNLEAKRLAHSGQTEPVLICAREQTAGRGRKDRRWVSIKDAGLWMTQLFRPTSVPAQDAGGAVFLSALSLCETLQTLTGAPVRIKWPNDLVLNGKKICGMLAECSFRDGWCDWIALGTGLDLWEVPLPKPQELPSWAGTLEGETGIRLSKRDILSDYLSRFDRYRMIWERESLSPILNAIIPLSATLGHAIRLGEDGTIGTATGFREDGALLIRTEEGKEQVILAGDVSVRGITDYIQT